MVSIIVATFNAEEHLMTLLNSIRYQSFNDLELIIIDGGSKDKTVDIIKSNSDLISYWISEPDNGIYDAWNKGINKASKEWIMFLGADDILLPSSIELYIDYIQNHTDSSNIDLISSKVQMIDKEGKNLYVSGWEWQWPKFLKKMTVAHPGALHSSKFFSKYGNYNISYKIVGDYELLLRAGNKLRAEFINQVTVKMTIGGASDSTKAIIEHYKASTQTGKANRFSILLRSIYVFLKRKINIYGREVGINLNAK